jgi:hypothetical protein
MRIGINLGNMTQPERKQNIFKLLTALKEAIVQLESTIQVTEPNGEVSHEKYNILLLKWRNDLELALNKVSKINDEIAQSTVAKSENYKATSSL